MGESPSVGGGLDDPDRAWRRPAPGDPPAPPAAPTWVAGSAAHDPERAIWGPEADLAGRPAPDTSGPTRPSTGWIPQPSPAWNPPGPTPTWVPSPSTAAAVGSLPPHDQRWEPTVGGAEPGGWGGPPGAPDIGIDERSAPPPRPPAGEQFGGWWARAGIVAAVLAVVIAVIAVASGSDPGGDAATATSVPRTSSTTSTTAPRTTTTSPRTTTTAAPSSTGGPAGDGDPADLAPEDDPRVMLEVLPDGFTATGARLMLDNHIGGLGAGLFFVTDASTWFDGPWVRVDSAADVSFIGPVVPVDLGNGRQGRLGTNQAGAEMVTVDTAVDGPGIAVSAKGLPAGTVGAIGSGLLVTADGSWSVPASALLAGLRPASGDLADSMSLRPVSSASVNYRGPAGVGVSVYSTLAQPGYDPQAVAAFYLSDLAYVTIRGEAGVMGSFGGGNGTGTVVQWRHLGVDVQVSAWGMDRSELLALAAVAATRLDGGWSEETWDDAEDGSEVAEASEPVRIGEPLDFGNVGGGTVQAQRAGSALSWWIDGSMGFSLGRYGQDAPPVLLQVASNPVPAIDVDGASYVVALALGDASIEGATLRVRTGSSILGGDGIGHDNSAIVHTISAAADDAAAGAPSEFGYTLAAAVSAPWPEGDFVAELIAADGVTILATATRADLL